MVSALIILMPQQSIQHDRSHGLASGLKNRPGIEKLYSSAESLGQHMNECCIPQDYTAIIN